MLDRLFLPDPRELFEGSPIRPTYGWTTKQQNATTVVASVGVGDLGFPEPGRAFVLTSAAAFFLAGSSQSVTGGAISIRDSQDNFITALAQLSELGRTTINWNGLVVLIPGAHKISASGNFSAATNPNDSDIYFAGFDIARGNLGLR